ncbi:MAG: hypothetical protein WCX64_01885 [Candidatus Micrarchaeia archaeon]
MEKGQSLNEKAAAISGAVTGSVLHLIFGMMVLAAPGALMGSYQTMYYGMMQFGNPGFAFGGWIISAIMGAIAGGFVGWLIAVSYNWGLKA